MNLFNKEKELILKITNGILLVWLLAAIVFTGSYIIDRTYPKLEYKYEEYKISYCRKYDEETEEKYESNCELDYKAYKLNNKENNYHQKKHLYTSVLNILVVGSGLFIINRKK